MTDEMSNLVLEHLRAVRADMSELKDGFARLEIRVGSLEQHIAAMHASFSLVPSDMDRLRARVERIERRLELADDQ